MYNFEKRVVIHDGKEVPSDDRYCLVLLSDGAMHRAFFDKEDKDWILEGDYIRDKDNVVGWFYIEDLFDAPKNVDIRFYLDEKEKQI